MSVDATAGQTLPASPTLPTGSMFSLGWLMAQLFGPDQHRVGSDTSAHLPTVAELDEDPYMEIAFLELEKLLTPLPGLSDADIKAAWNTADHKGFTDAVKALHLKVLQQFADNRPELSAYQLGRAAPPAVPPAGPATPAAPELASR